MSYAPGSPKSQSRAFVLKQTAALLRLGVSPADVARSVAWVDAHLPPGEDAATWVPSATDLADDLLNEAALLDARLAWWQEKNVPRRFRALLDARSA